jgi:hypothetical protein
MSERVDKSWHSKGIDTYSVPAILGTLAHYGVAVTEEQFLELAKEDFPLTIATTWHERWKGTGQFSRFPAAAAEELWRRLKPGVIAPTDVALAIVNLLNALDAALDKKADDGTWDTRFKVVEAYLPSIPSEPERRELFMSELVAALSDYVEVFDGMAEALARRDQQALADRFTAFEEALIPERKGVSAALVQAARGQVSEAMKALVGIAGDASRDAASRLAAIDGLFLHEQLDDARKFTLELVDLAEKEKDVDLASDVVERLSELLRRDPKRADRDDLRRRVEQLARTLEP